MRSLALNYDVVGAVRLGIVALGLFTLTLPPVIVLSSPDAFAAGSGKSDDDRGGDSGKGGDSGFGASAGTGSLKGDATRNLSFAGPGGKAEAKATLNALSSFASGTKSTSLRAGGNAAGGSVSAKAAAAGAGTAGGGAATNGGTTGAAPTTDGSAGTGGLDGRAGLSASDGSSIAAAFESLTRPQQARVMQRCRDVVAKPAQAEAKQLAICQTLVTLAKQ